MHSVGLGFGARVGGIHGVKQNDAIKGKPKQKPKSVRFLKEMLREARTREKNIADMLKVAPKELPEYDDLLDRLAKLEKLILQVNLQIIEQESK